MNHWRETLCLKCAHIRLGDRFPERCANCGAGSVWLIAPPPSRDQVREMTRRIRRQNREVQKRERASGGIGARGPSSGAVSLSRAAPVTQGPRAPMPPEAR